MATLPNISAAPTVRSKEFHFPLEVEWLEGRQVEVQVVGKAPLLVAPPEVFKGDDPTVWSPEDLLVAAAASCLAVTFTGEAVRAGLEHHTLKVSADGICGLREDGRFGFTAIKLLLEIEVDAGNEAQARELAEKAERSCLVSASLALEVELEVAVTSLPL